MLPTSTQERFLEALPDTVDIRVSEGETRRYTFEQWWANEDHDTVYPCIVATLSPRGIPRVDDQPIDDLIRTEPNPAPNIAYDEIRGVRMYDGLTLTVADRGMSDGVSAADRASMMGEKLARWLIHSVRRSALAEAGGHNEIPIKVPTGSVEGPVDRSGLVGDVGDSGPSEGGTVARYAVEAQLNYTEAVRDAIPSVADLDIQFTGLSE